MKRSWVCGCAVAVSLAGLTHAQEVQWRAVGSKKPTPAIQPTAAQFIEPPLPTPIVPSSPEPPTVMPPASAAPELIPSPSRSALPGPSNYNPIISYPSASAMQTPAPPLADGTLPMPSATMPMPNASAVPFIAGPVVADPTSSCGDCGDNCGTCGNCWCCDDCGPRFWVRGEFLAWWTKSTGVPPLLTTSRTALPANDNNIGAIGRSDTILLLGGKQLDDQFRPGARFSAGGSIDPCGIIGFDGSVFFTGQRRNSFAANDAQFPQLFRPFFAANAGIPGIGNVPGEYREIVFSVPAGVGGNFVAESESFFWGADANLRRNIICGCGTRTDAFVGFRYLHLDEELRMIEFARINQFNPAVGVPVGSTMTVRDRFKTENDFYGGQIGIEHNYQRDKWSVGLRTSVAFGATQEQISVAGSQVVAIAGQVPQAFNGGLLALNSNIGSRSDSRFAVVPEATVRVGYQFTERLKLTAGYDFLYWSDVVRPDDQIDRIIDVNRIPNFRTAAPVTAVRPAPLFNTTDFWAQGINVGAEYRW